MLSTLLFLGAVLVGLLVLLAVIVSLSARPETTSRPTAPRPATSSPGTARPATAPHPAATARPTAAELPVPRADLDSEFPVQPAQRAAPLSTATEAPAIH